MPKIEPSFFRMGVLVPRVCALAAHKWFCLLSEFRIRLSHLRQCADVTWSSAFFMQGRCLRQASMASCPIIASTVFECDVQVRCTQLFSPEQIWQHRIVDHWSTRLPCPTVRLATSAGCLVSGVDPQVPGGVRINASNRFGHVTQFAPEICALEIITCRFRTDCAAIRAGPVHPAFGEWRLKPGAGRRAPGAGRWVAAARSGPGHATVFAAVRFTPVWGRACPSFLVMVLDCPKSCQIKSLAWGLGPSGDDSSR